MYNELKILYTALGHVNKTRTQQSLTHLIYDLSSLVVLTSKSRTLSLPKQNKTNPILKTLYVKKVQQI